MDEAAGEEHGAAQRTWPTAALVAIGAALWLACLAPLFGAGRLHVGGPFIDQAGHVTTARNLAQTGELRFGLVFPAYARTPEWRPYMPGHAWLLAASYRALGYGVFASLLPSLLGFVVSCAGLFVVGSRLYGRRAGLAAAVVFALFPGNTTYAFTAMQDASFVAVCVLALVAFVLAPVGVRPWAMPACVALAFLFRETALLLVIPFGWILWRTHPHPVRGLLLGCLSSFLLVEILGDWQRAQGKELELFSFLLRGHFNYLDAFAPPLEPTPGAVLAAVGPNLARNLAELGDKLAANPFQLATVGLAALVAAAAWSFVAGLRRGATDRFACGAGALGLAVVLIVLALYDVKGQKALRTSLFAFPFAALGVAGTLDLLDPRNKGRRGDRRAGRPVWIPALAGLVVLDAALTFDAARELRASDGAVDATTRAIESLEHDDSELLIVAHDLYPLAIDYAVVHYPVPWSFMPSNEETLELLQGRFRLGTLIISAAATGGAAPPAAAAGGTLRFVRKLELGGQDYLVYQRPG